MAHRGPESSTAALSASLINRFQSRLKGNLLRPGQDNYNDARKVWNGSIDKHPYLIARCFDDIDIVNSLNFARENNILVAVRGGGHDLAGNSVCNGGLVIDLSYMKDINVDSNSRIASVQGGVYWGQFDRTVEPSGLATTGGSISKVGVGGFTLGGGLGWLARKYGLACDNLISARVVLADGRLLTVNQAENPDLLWGLRGGGGNFGIVTSFDFQLHPIGPIQAGLIIHEIDKAAKIMEFIDDFVPKAPDDLSIAVSLMTAPFTPFLPEKVRGRRVAAIIVFRSGESQRDEEAVETLRTFESPMADLVKNMPYSAWQSMFDSGAPAGFQNYWKSIYMRGISRDAISVMTKYAASAPSTMTRINLHLLGGAIGRVGENDTAMSHRDSAFLLNISSTWADVAESEQNIHWTKEFYKDMRPYVTGGVYLNMSNDRDDAQIAAAYGSKKLALLADLKRKYDPDNLFRSNFNIKPAVK